MRRLVYSPHVKAFINGDDGVVDISPYLVRGSVTRKVNQVSSAELILRNPISQTTDPSSGEIAGRMLWTEHMRSDGAIGPRFFPMDPIVITMQRIAGYPIQVFTGYLDTAPYLQLFPGLCKIEASCTLKRLLYTQWDAALPFVKTFLTQNGWILSSESGLANPTAESKKLQVEAGQVKGQFNDGSIGRLLHEVLVHIGNWDTNTIWIEALPPQIKDLVTNLYNQIQPEVKAGEETFKSMLDQILKTNSQGSGSPTKGAPAPGGTGTVFRVKASAEDASSGNGWTELSSNGNGAGAAGHQQSGNCTGGSVGGCDFATLGKAYPHGTMLNIRNPATNKSGTFPLTDVGNGSSFGPAIGLTPTVQGAIGWSDGQEVEIQLTGGGTLSVVSGFGTKIK